MDNPDTLATLGNDEWTIQRNLLHWALKNGQFRHTGNIGNTRYKTNKRQRIPKGQSKIDNPETLATQGTHDEGDKQSKNTTQYVLDTNICKQTKIT